MDVLKKADGRLIIAHVVAVRQLAAPFRDDLRQRQQAAVGPQPVRLGDQPSGGDRAEGVFAINRAVLLQAEHGGRVRAGGAVAHDAHVLVHRQKFLHGLAAVALKVDVEELQLLGGIHLRQQRVRGRLRRAPAQQEGHQQQDQQRQQAIQRQQQAGVAGGGEGGVQQGVGAEHLEEDVRKTAGRAALPQHLRHQGIGAQIGAPHQQGLQQQPPELDALHQVPEREVQGPGEQQQAELDPLVEQRAEGQRQLLAWPPEQQHRRKAGGQRRRQQDVDQRRLPVGRQTGETGPGQEHHRHAQHVQAPVHQHRGDGVADAVAHPPSGKHRAQQVAQAEGEHEVHQIPRRQGVHQRGQRGVLVLADEAAPADGFEDMSEGQQQGSRDQIQRRAHNSASKRASAIAASYSAGVPKLMCRSVGRASTAAPSAISSS